ncbi:deoxycytidine triphosphate deaminase [Candidatus Microgenomates bacterium]|nr:deoxycytidine triphosphate deaminase [Candidatus Microgenomates bacterium]
MGQTNNLIAQPGQGVHIDVAAGGVYSNRDIKQGVADGRIVIHPYVKEHVKGSSYDVTIGEWFYRTERSETRHVYNPFDPKEVSRYFGKPQRAIKHSDWCRKHDRKLFANIPPGHPIIVLGPDERILAHTHEFIGINPPGTTELRARSSWGRNGVAACFDAGWGDPGYINRWTMEVYNLNQHEAVVIPVGERIAQMVFHHTGEVDNEYGAGGKYQVGGKLKELIRQWKPEDMLPKAYKDQRKWPLPL